MTAIKGRAAAHLNFPELADLLPLRRQRRRASDVRAAAALAAAADFPAGCAPAATLQAEMEPGPVPDPEDALFDLPDLLLDLRYESPSGLACAPSCAADVADGGSVGANADQGRRPVRPGQRCAWD
nr:ethylene-responsive transcription factor ERF039-like [Lolium perenne]